MPEALSLRQPIQFLKIDVEGFELHALESASKLFERNLVDNVLIEFGPHSRWMNTLDPLRYDKKERRRMTIKHCRRVLHQMTGPWGFDLYILPSDGFEATAELFKRLELDLTPDGTPGSFDNRVFHKLFAHDFNGKAFPADDPFAVKMKQMGYHVTDLIPLKKKYIDHYSNDLEDMGEIYLWAIRRDSPGAKIILEKTAMA
ncbi:hypothetical protein BC940DRAFT_232307 [Gongronella butleri]|nr:hypothetical protein BC940DRAFT_232307 [Gongronella butleri]